MGQHKYNPTALAAKRGELPPKPPRMGKWEWKRRVAAVIDEKTGVNRITQMMGGGPYG